MTNNNRAKLFQKILEVQRALEPIEKSGRNEFHRYAYTTSSDVLLPVQRACNEHGLVVIADVIDTKIYPERSAAEVLVRLTVFDSETGESHSVTASGYSEDWSYRDNKPVGDKAVYKSTTGAIKYAVKAFFCLPSEDDPERVTPTPVATPAIGNGKTHKTTVNTLQSDEPTSTNGKHQKTVIKFNNPPAPAPRPQQTWSEEPPTTPDTAIPTVLEETTREMERLGWSVNQGQRFLEVNFGVLSRKHLTSGQLRQFLDFLRSQPSPRSPVPVPS